MDPIMIFALVLFAVMIMCWIALPGGTTTTAVMSEREPVVMTSVQSQA